MTLNEEFPRLQVMRGPKKKGVRYFGPVLARLGDPRDPRPAAARLPGPHLLGRRVQAGRPGRPAVPARLHRQVLGALRRPGQRRRAPARSSRTSATSWPARPRPTCAGSRRRCRSPRPTRSTSGRPGCATTSRRSSARWRSSRWSSATAPTPTWSRSPRTRSRRRCRSSTSAAAGSAASAAGWWRRSRTSPPATWSSTSCSRSTAATTARLERRCRARCWCRRCRRTPTRSRDWLPDLRGSRVALRVPQRGDKRALMETVARNAGQALALHKTRRGSDLTARSQALEEIQEALGLDEAPLRIECYDVSHLQDSDVVASMVVFEDGLRPQERVPPVRHQGPGGPAGVRRRRRRHPRGHQPAVPPATSTSGPRPASSRTPSGAGVDGRRCRPASTRRPAGRAGSPTRRTWSSSTAARRRSPRPQRALDELGVDDVALCGLAKRLEEVWLPGEAHPVVLPRTSEGLYLLQRVRDEAHRFAITFHRSAGPRSMTASALDGVPGLGETRRKALLKHFGSLQAAVAPPPSRRSPRCPGVGPRTAEAVVAALAGRSRRPLGGQHRDR